MTSADEVHAVNTSKDSKRATGRRPTSERPGARRLGEHSDRQQEINEPVQILRSPSRKFQGDWCHARPMRKHADDVRRKIILSRNQSRLAPSRAAYVLARSIGVYTILKPTTRSCWHCPKRIVLKVEYRFDIGQISTRLWRYFGNRLCAKSVEWQRSCRPAESTLRSRRLCLIVLNWRLKVWSPSTCSIQRRNVSIKFSISTLPRSIDNLFWDLYIY